MSRVSQLTRTVKQRIVYRDFTNNLLASPISGDLETLTNAACVIQSIRNLVLTYPGERYYQPLVGSTVTRALFEFIDQFSTDQLRDSIYQTLNNYEPRAQNVAVFVTADVVNHAYNIDIQFSVVALPGVIINVPTIVVGVRG